MFKVIIFDFDGVILESLDIKTKAFIKVYQEYPEHADEIAQYHLQNGGVSRYKKFVHINSNILGIPIDENEIEELAKKFSDYTAEGILNCTFVPGALELLSEYSKIAKLYIASGTPQEELRSIVEKRGLTQYFSGVYGTPQTKVEIIRDILGKENVDKKEAVFIGDSITDYESAREANIPFIARINGQTPDNPFLKMNVISVNDLKELDTLLEKGF